jgi:hypothetical protein
VLAAGSSYPPLTLVVSIAVNAPPVVVNSVAVSGGGEIVTGNDESFAALSILPRIQLQRRRGA